MKAKKASLTLALAAGLVLLTVLLVSAWSGAAQALEAEASVPPAASATGPTVVEGVAAQANGFTRTVERVDAPRDFTGMTDRSLALDSSGHPHVAYGRDNLYHAWHDGSAWHSEVVDEDWSAAVGLHAAIAFDSSDHPHIAYYDLTNADLKYARWTGSAWDVQIVDSDGWVGEYTSLALDENDYPHISYRGATSNTLKYARWTGSAWAIETVDRGFIFDTSMAGYTSLALESTAPYTPHVSYRYLDNLKHAWYSGTTWVSETVESGGIYRHTSLALDGDGNPRISYLSGDVRYAWYSGTMWTIQIVDGVPGGNGGFTSLALEPTAPYTPHVSYYDDTSRALAYAWYNGTIWMTQTVDSGTGVGKYTSLALDSSDNPHISYNDEPNGVLKYARWTGGAWITQPVDGSGNVGQHTSLVVDSFGDPHIGYYDQANHDLKYARWTGSTWVSQTVESDGMVGQCASLALDGNGHPHVSYYHAISNTIKYARWAGSVWTIGAVDSCGSGVGGCTSLALESTAPYTPHVSYYDGGARDLKYARWADGVWMTQTVDSGGIVGEYNALALGGDGYPRISYYDATSDSLKYAWFDGTSWLSETVDSGLGLGGSGAGGGHTSLALDGEDRPHISYYDANDGDLKYAWYNSTTWMTQTVDRALGNDGGYASLALVSAAPYTPYVSYHDATNGDLRRAWYSGAVWITETLDSDGDVGQFTSLALDGFGHVHVSYYDVTNGDLKYTGWHVTRLFLPLVLRNSQ